MAVREIIFRGKREDNGEWVYGFYFEEIGSFIKEKPSSVSTNTYLVTPETVGQYTGLTDKNGKQIFEGDLLNGFQYPFLNDNAHNYFAEVVWLENSTAFGLYTHKHPLSAVRGLNEGCDYMEDFDSSQWEIIGNIHDNPELLKGGAE